MMLPKTPRNGDFDCDFRFDSREWSCSDQPYVYTQNELQEIERAWEIAAADVRLEELVGSGSFGEVWRGRWQGIMVAVKKSNSRLLADEQDVLRDFAKEMKVGRAWVYICVYVWVG